MRIVCKGFLLNSFLVNEFLHFWLGSISIPMSCAGPRLDSCNFVTPRLDFYKFLQVKMNADCGQQVKIVYNFDKFSKITTFFRSTGVISRIWHTTHKGRTLLLVFYQKKCVILCGMSKLYRTIDRTLDKSLQNQDFSGTQLLKC